ncbi:hypothetical protein [Scytonema sp. PRP1]|uniref:hypothetical protein n=1 Tax=Scytonema sp. PRP1 TaxID=3120513 RepID=UPI00300D07C3
MLHFAISGKLEVKDQTQAIIIVFQRRDCQFVKARLPKGQTTSGVLLLEVERNHAMFPLGAALHGHRRRAIAILEARLR